jgi:5-methyltetrahydropteroyltriglutamate--homocysteine methyltransferase
MAKSANLGFPRLGADRQWKKACEKYWASKITLDQLIETADQLTAHHWQLQSKAGIDIIPANDFSFYDQVLDTTALVGAVPARYLANPSGDVDHNTYFAMARGRQDKIADLAAQEMTKWFDTNYHYIVPEFSRETSFRLASHQPFRAVEQARRAGVVQPRPVLVGPATYLLQGKIVSPGLKRLDLAEELVKVYSEVLTRLQALGVAWVQLDEPALAGDLDEEGVTLFRRIYDRLAVVGNKPNLMLATYFGGLDDNTELALSLGAEGLHLDLVRAPEQLATVLDSLNRQITLSCGVVNGRNVWRTDLDASLALLRTAVDRVGSDHIEVAPSCSLLHCPLDLSLETKLDPEIREWMAFGLQKLDEVVILTRALNEGVAAVAEAFQASRTALQRRAAASKTANPQVRAAVKAITPNMYQRQSPFPVRQKLQQDKFNFPPLPTTSVGSFPQTYAVRRLRADQRKGLITPADVDIALKAEITKTIRFQEEAGLDQLVHGEFERNDMVEYFGEQMEGFVFTQNGWVQSYGSRAVKPPIIYGDVRRRGPMTVAWSQFAQLQSSKPVKGMLTGPVTMLEWSFVRDDQPRRDTCLQLALAVREETHDLEAAGITAIQIDEPALREGMPLRRSGWEAYLKWAVDSFRLASTGVRDDTQIQTHMCYAEFNDIMAAIAAMDADVLLIEASRSGMELLDVFSRFNYPNDVGPGVYDIHSPRVPGVEEMADLLRLALKHVSWKKLWVVPDCGLKTRRWEEVIPALQNMVKATQQVRLDLRKRLLASGESIT